MGPDRAQLAPVPPARPSEREEPLLWEYLNLEWLRPESALWNAITASVMRESGHPFERPCLDVGAGTGLFSFIAAGGRLSPDHDLYRNVGHLDAFWAGADIYDQYHEPPNPSLVNQRPAHTFDCAFDHKENLKRQAAFLRFYDDYRIGDANRPWPFAAGQFRSVFSNMLYWLDDPAHCFSELARILASGGKASLFLLNPTFAASCPTYRSGDYPPYQALLRQLNRGRADCRRWEVTDEELDRLAARQGFRILRKRPCLSPLILQLWDIGLRPLSPVLIKMANACSPDQRRRSKQEWVEICYQLLLPLFRHEHGNPVGGYTFCVLERR